MSWCRVLFSFLLCIVLAGCTGGSPRTYFYTLSQEKVLDQKVDLPSMGIELAEFPDYLDRIQFVLRTGENRLEIVEQHRWAGSFQGQFLGVLTEDISGAGKGATVLPFPWEEDFTPKLRVSVALLRLDGSLGGEVVLKARWTLRSSKGVVLRKTSMLKEMAGGDYDSLVAAKSRLIAALAREIALAATAPGPG